jgi:transposase, IS5 family
MYKSQSSFQSSFFGDFAFRQVVERNRSHLLIRLNEAIDLSFVEEIVADCYSHETGRRAYHPAMMFRILFLQTLYDESDEKIIEAVDTNILFRYFVGLSLEDDIPDRTLLGKFKVRLGEERFTAIFNRIVALAKEVGLIDNRLRLIDCSSIKADVDLYRCKKDKKDDDDHTFIDRNTSDPDASTGYKSPQDKWYGYKSGIMLDPSSEIVTAVTITTAKTADVDHLETLVIRDKLSTGGAKRLCGDKGFVGREAFLKENKTVSNVIRRDNMRKPRRLSYRLDKLVRPIIEHKFAEGKKYHGLSKARYRGRWRVHIQSLLIYITMNLKKLVNYLRPIGTKTKTSS